MRKREKGATGGEEGRGGPEEERRKKEGRKRNALRVFVLYESATSPVYAENFYSPLAASIRMVAPRAAYLRASSSFRSLRNDKPFRRNLIPKQVILALSPRGNRLN